MRKLARVVGVSILMSCAASSLAKAPADPKADNKPDGKDGKDGKDKGSAAELQPESETTRGAVTIAGHRVDYTAIAGTLIVHKKGEEDPPEQTGDDDKPAKPRTTAAMSY